MSPQAPDGPPWAGRDSTWWPNAHKLLPAEPVICVLFLCFRRPLVGQVLCQGSKDYQDSWLLFYPFLSIISFSAIKYTADFEWCRLRRHSKGKPRRSRLKESSHHRKIMDQCGTWCHTSSTSTPLPSTGTAFKDILSWLCLKIDPHKKVMMVNIMANMIVDDG